MLWIFNFNLKESKVKTYQQFVKDNEKAITEHAPKGWKYRGTYFYVLGFGPCDGASLWECPTYDDFD